MCNLSQPAVRERHILVPGKTIDFKPMKLAA
jgi:hypothetical protein